MDSTWSQGATRIGRRRVLRALGAVGVAAAAGGLRADAPAAGGRAFTLIHNGFAGGWVWTDVARRLRGAGHDVYTPTLTGLGERAHLANPEIGLATHVQDIVGVLECEQLSNIVLVASSSSAMVAAGVAERMAEKIARLVYIDTIEPKDGQSWMDLLTPQVAAPLLEAARRHGDGWRVPRRDLVPPRWVAHPLRSVTDALTVSNAAARRLPRSYVHALARPKGWFLGLGAVIDTFAARVRTEGWDYHEIASDHLPQLSAPEELAAILNALPG